MSSIPCLKLNPSSTASPTCSSYPSTTKPRSYRPLSLPLRIRSSQTDQGPLRRPVSPPVRQPSLSPPPSLKPTPPSPPPPPSTSPPPPPPPVTASAETAVESGVKGITLEFQRQKAKELQAYFKQKKLEEASQGPFFGFVGKNEISNGRWAMFGFAVGMLTEYATGSDFVDQVKILLSNFGILDLD